MEKTITIGDKAVKLNNNIGWALAYRDQFGRDIIPALMPMIASALDIVSGIIEETGKTKNIRPQDILSVLDGDKFTDAVIHLSGLEFVDFIDIVWALAKCADENIPEPKEWVKGFETFPLDEIVPAVFGLIAKGLISSKNFERLKTIMGRLQPTTTQSIPTPSSSPDSSEG